MPDIAVPTRIGILGAGKLGTVLARLAVAAGYEVLIAGSGDPKYIALTVDVFARGAVASTASEAIEGADLVILAIPLYRVDSLPVDALSGHIVIDATNHWVAVDGPLPEFTAAPGGTSTVVASKLAGARIVKASAMSATTISTSMRGTGVVSHLASPRMTCKRPTSWPGSSNGSGSSPC